MTDWLGRVLMIVLATALLGLPLVLSPAEHRAALAANAPVLVVLTSHNEHIREEFAQAYNRNRQARQLPPVQFDWRSGGTSDMRRLVLAELTREVRLHGENATLSYDLFFGGGDYDHNLLAKGVTVAQGDKSLTVSASVPAGLPEAFLNEVYPKPTIGDEPLYHPKRQWLGVALSSFGIVYNRDALKLLSVPEPRNWPDLANPKLDQWVALADPAHSGSIAQTYHIVLRRLGWKQGWAVLRRTFANARAFQLNSSQASVDVSSGEAAAGMCIDFYGRYQAGVVGDQRVGYVDPAAPEADGRLSAMTAITPDPVSLIRGSPHRELAVDFITWLLSKEAQHLWQLRAGVEGGPRRFELRRLPIRQDVYADEQRKHWTDPQAEPFAIASPLPREVPNYFSLVSPVTHALAADVHEDLQAAWRTLQRTPEADPRKAKMLELFDALPEELTLRFPDPAMEAAWLGILSAPGDPRRPAVVAALQAFSKSLDERVKQPEALQRDRQRWTAFFRANYRAIVAMGG